jgi:hypothetical protein
VFEVLLACTGCPGQGEVVVAELDELSELEGIACECGYGCVVLAIGETELVPVHG